MKAITSKPDRSAQFPNELIVRGEYYIVRRSTDEEAVFRFEPLNAWLRVRLLRRKAVAQ